MAHRRDALGDIRQKVFDRADQDLSQTDNAVSVVDAMINDAVDQVALDAPFLFHDKLIRIATQADVSPLSTSDTITLITNTDDPGNIANPWVFRLDLHTSIAGGGTTRALWENDRSWDGRMIDIIESDETVHTARIQQVWKEVDGGGSDTYVFVSLDRPFPWWEYGVGPFDWRVYTPQYYFPDNVVELKSMRIVGDDYPTPVQVIGQTEAEEIGIVDDQYSLSEGVPRFAYRRTHFEMPAPNTSPTWELPNGTPPTPAWLGPEPAGTFQYLYTLCWGKRDHDYAAPGIPNWNDENLQGLQTNAAQSTAVWNRNRSREPLWESSPSPVSTEVTTTNAQGGESANDYPGPGIVLTFPNIEYMLGFLLTGTTTGSTAFDRYHSSHSGWSIRIYRRRIAEDYINYTELGTTHAGQHITGLDKLDIQDAYFLLSEFEIEATVPTVYVDDGTAIPDYRRRLRNVHGYQGFQLYPRPDARYEIEARVLQRPERLVSDSDAPSVHPEAVKLITDYALFLFHQRDHDFMSAKYCHEQYQEKLRTVTKRYSELRPRSQAIQRYPARSKGYTRVGYRWWKRSSG